MKIDEASQHLDRRLKFLEGHFPSHPAAQNAATNEIEALKIALDAIRFFTGEIEFKPRAKGKRK